MGRSLHIMERAVERGRKRKKRRAIKKMGVDEKSLGKGHNYLTLVYDLEAATVEHIEDDRRKESLDGYFSLLPSQQRAKIEAIATDIWHPYLASIREHVPESEEKLVFDRYHLMTHMVKAVDAVRKQEHRELMGEGSDLLTGTKYLWLYSRENMPAMSRVVGSSRSPRDLGARFPWPLTRLKLTWSLWCRRVMRMSIVPTRPSR